MAAARACPPAKPSRRAGPCAAALTRGWGLAALVLFALLAGFALPASAQTAITLVSNSGQTPASSSVAVGTLSGIQYIHAQKFTTGKNEDGYTLSEVTVVLSGVSTSEQVSGSIYTATDSGAPGTSLHTLTNPASFTNGENTFTAPSNATLAKETDYFVVLEASDATTRVNAALTTTNGEDAGGQDNWTIADLRHWRSSTDTAWDTDSKELVIVIRGTVTSGVVTANSAPTASNGTVTVNEDTAYTFEADPSLPTSLRHQQPLEFL